MSSLAVESSATAKEEEKFHRPEDRYFFCFTAAVITIMLIVIVIVNPQNPRFSVREAQIDLKLPPETPSLLQFNNSSINLSLVANNANRKLGIYYDEFLVTAFYNGSEITGETSVVAPFYLGHGETTILNATLVGNGNRQQQLSVSGGHVELEFKARGYHRLKLGRYWFSDWFPFTVVCSAPVSFGTTSPPPLMNSICSVE